MSNTVAVLGHRRYWRLFRCTIESQDWGSERDKRSHFSVQSEHDNGTGSVLDPQWYHCRVYRCAR